MAVAVAVRSTGTALFILAADVSTASTVSITWQGHQVEVLPGRWIVRMEAAPAGSQPDARLTSATALSAALSQPIVHDLALQSLLADGFAGPSAGEPLAALSVSRQLSDDTYLLVGDRQLDANDVASIFDSLSLSAQVEPDFVLHVEGAIPPTHCMARCGG